MSAHCEKHGCNLVYTEYPFMECPMCAAEDRADDPQMLKVAQRDAARLVQDVQGHALQAVNSANLPYMNQRAMDYVQGMTQWSEATREAYTQELPAS